MKVAFIIGHHEKSKGFYSTYLGTTEYELYSSLESELKEIGDVYKHDPSIFGYTSRCKEISNRIGDKYDIIVALHFNAGGGKGGTEVFYWHKNRVGRQIAKFISEEYSRDMGIINRGAKPYTKSTERGAAEVFYPKGTVVLFEPFFGDNEGDCSKWDKDKLLSIIQRVKEEEWKVTKTNKDD